MWTPSPICGDCIEYLLNTQWKRFLELVEKADCRAAMIRLCMYTNYLLLYFV